MRPLALGLRGPNRVAIGRVRRMVAALRRLGGNLWMVDNAFSGAFVDNVGTTPVTAYADLLGLTTDRLGVLGPNLVTTPSVTGAAIDGVTSITTYANGPGRMVAGDAYQVTYTVTGFSGTSDVGFLSGSFALIPNGSRATANGTYTFVATAINPDIVTFTRPISNTANLSNITVRKLTGSHATQSAVASKPTVQRVPKRLGPNAVVNGTFDSGTTGWTQIGGVSQSASGGVLTVTSVGAAGGSFQDVLTQAATVKITVRARNVSGSGSQIWGLAQTGGFTNSTIATVSSTSWQDYPLVVNRISGASGVRVYITAQTNPGAIEVDSVEVQEVLEWASVISFDGNNDFLTLGSVPFQMTDDHCVIAGAATNDISTFRALFACSNSVTANSRIQLYTAQTSGLLTGMWRDDANVANLVSIGTTSAGVPYVATMRKVGSQLAGRKDGGAWVTTTAALGATTLNRADICAASAVGTPSSFHSGPLYAEAVVKGTVSDADVAIIEQGIAALQGRTL